MKGVKVEQHVNLKETLHNRRIGMDRIDKGKGKGTEK